jgi:voltage-gated potassium channel
MLIFSGALGYHLTEGWSAFDSLYMAVITLTTIGFSEVHPLSNAGRSFTMVLSLSGIFTIFFATSEILRSWASGELRALMGRQRFEKAMSKLRDHVIVCGYGRMGRLVCQELSRVEVPFIILDNSPERLADFALKGGVPLHVDATNDESLRRAGIDKARALVTVLPSDADNLFITMSARLLNEKLPIISRAEEEATASKLMRAGASRVVSPYVIGGARVAQAILQPAVLDFIDVATRSEHLELQLEEVVVAPTSQLAGRSIADTRIRTDLNVIIVALKSPGSRMSFNPKDDAVIQSGETLVMLGAREQLNRIERMANT